jgi:inosose dehydratase
MAAMESKVTIGSAPDSWGVWFPSDPKQTPWQRYMDEVVEAGYEWTELGPYGYLPTDIPTLRAELAKRGLKVAATAVMGHLEDPSAWPEFERQILGAAEALVAVGGRFLVLIDDTYSNVSGTLRLPKRLDEDAWKRLIERTHEVAEIAVDRFGLVLAFHPHAETHVEYEDQIERFLAETDPARIFLCFDTGHHAYRGGDAIAFMRRHHARIPYLHLKSVDPTVQARVQAEDLPFATAVAEGVFCEPAKGAVNFLAFRDLLREIGWSGYATVEQDMYPAPFDKPLPIARRTRQYLREIGIG